VLPSTLWNFRNGSKADVDRALLFYGEGLETLSCWASAAVGVDRIMDMMRTTTNVSGDAEVATTVAAMTGELDREELVSADDV